MQLDPAAYYAEYPSSEDAPSAEDLAETLGYREAAEEGAAAAPPATTESTPLKVDWSAAISSRAHDFIVGWETGGKAYYEKVIKARPVWPEFSSGITIGCGYDLGYHKADEFRADWSGRIPASSIQRLSAAIGFRTVEPGRAAKVAKARQLVQAFSDIVVPWDVALRQFDEGKMPAIVAQLYRALDNLNHLHPHSRGALLSLVFNRGSGGFTSSKDRFREMRQIARLMTGGDPADISQIPGLLRSMTRIWGASSSLAKRRRQEADLFEAGMVEQGLAGWIQSHATTESVAGAVTEAVTTLAEDHADVEMPTDTDDDDLDEALLSMTEGPGPTVSDVRWNPSDDEQPDYRHLPRPGGEVEFELTAEDLETLVRFNAFRPRPGKLIFALRGCRILGADKREGVTALTLSDQRPDHRDYRCVIGALDRETGKIWAYRASTVPQASALVTCFRLGQAGAALSGNILPTGLYTYTVGTHRGGTSHEIRGVLRLGQTPTGASVVTVLRSLNDVVYDRRDFWDKCAPADNIHPGRRNQGFSSLGCLTLPGNYDTGSRTHSGLWADFRVALGMGRTFAASDDGKQFSVMLVTGLDAALASRMRAQGALDGPEAKAALTRLRFGSQGPLVARLQEQLGLAPDNSQLIGPVTRGALVALQQHRLGWADGILSPEGETDLQLSVLG